MKKSIFIIAFALFTTVSFAQDKFELKANPIGWAFGATNLSLETSLPNHDNITFNASAWHYSKRLKETFDYGRSGGASVGFRRYVMSRRDEGMFLGAAARYISQEETYYDYNYNTGFWELIGEKNTSYASMGATLGYKFVFDRLTVDSFVGVGRILYQSNQPNWGLPAEFMGGINFGYRF